MNTNQSATGVIWHRCEKCGVVYYSTTGTTHTCTSASTYTYDPSLARMATALEKIAESLPARSAGTTDNDVRNALAELEKERDKLSSESKVLVQELRGILDLFPEREDVNWEGWVIGNERSVSRVRHARALLAEMEKTS